MPWAERHGPFRPVPRHGLDGGWGAGTGAAASLLGSIWERASCAPEGDLCPDHSDPPTNHDGGTRVGTVRPMPSARDMLERFRPVGTPGPAAPAGVPMDRRAQLEAELGPVLSALSATEGECERIRSSAQAHAERTRSEAAARASGVIANARSRAEAERAAVAAHELRRSERQAAAEVAAAAREAAELGRRARVRTPPLVAQVVDRVRATLISGTSS
jgi:hypothetical protein